MTAPQKRLMVRVITKLIVEEGMTFDQAIAKYPKLTPAEVQELREAIGV